MGAYAALLGEVIRAATQTDCLKESAKNEKMYFSGWLGKSDYDALVNLVPKDRRFKNMLEDKEKTKPLEEDHAHVSNKNLDKIVVFPGVTMGFAEKKDAKQHVKIPLQSKQAEPRKIIFEVTNCQAMTYNHCAGPVRRLAFRLTGILECYTTEEYSRGKYHHVFRLHYVHKVSHKAGWKV